MASEWCGWRAHAGDTEGSGKRGKMMLEEPGQRQQGHREGDGVEGGERKERG